MVSALSTRARQEEQTALTTAISLAWGRSWKMETRTSSGRSEGPTCFDVEGAGWMGDGGARKRSRTGGLGKLGGKSGGRCMVW